MSKVSRTIRLDRELSNSLDKVCVRHGDVTWHIEQALKDYLDKLEKEMPE
jgi:predicted transcriptional regulator